MTHIIAIALQKGGAGKTTTTAALGSELTARGASVLLIDLDPQANLTTALGVDPTGLPTVYELLLNGPKALALVIRETPYGVLVPSSIDLAGAELTLACRIGRELLLKQALAGAPAFDYILIDAPPTLGLLAANALVAANTVLVPLQTHPPALRALVQLGDTIELVKPLNAGLTIGGIVLTMTEHTIISGVIEDAARGRFGDLVFETTIPRTVRITEAPASGKPIGSYAPDSAGANAYRELTEEVLRRWPRE